MDIQVLLASAIKDRLVIEFHYEGQPRLIEPFTLGIHKDTGNVVLCGFRVGGYSKSENDPPWRLFIVPQMSNVSITEIVAENYRAGYNPKDSRMSRIICTA